MGRAHREKRAEETEHGEHRRASALVVFLMIWLREKAKSLEKIPWEIETADLLVALPRLQEAVREEISQEKKIMIALCEETM